MRKRLIIKSIWQVFLVFFEVFGITTFLVYLSHFIEPISSNIVVIERYISFIALYEIFVYITLTFVNDARRDSLLALRTAYEIGKLYCQSNNEHIKNKLDSDINKVIDEKYFNHNDIILEYKYLQTYIETKDDLSIDYKLIGINHAYEMCELKWKFTFLLQLFKLQPSIKY
jgi:hypothetical protein